MYPRKGPVFCAQKKIPNPKPNRKITIAQLNQNSWNYPLWKLKFKLLVETYPCRTEFLCCSLEVQHCCLWGRGQNLLENALVPETIHLLSSANPWHPIVTGQDLVRDTSQGCKRDMFYLFLFSNTNAWWFMLEAVIVSMKKIKQFRWRSQPTVARARNLRSLFQNQMGMSQNRGAYIGVRNLLLFR